MVIISPKEADPVSDNDSISLTSTVASAHSENEFFEVKRILAENPNSNTATFLIQWEGYPVSRATWEPRKQIRHLRSVINEWRQTQKLEQSGIQESFDTTAWAAAREESEDERQSRKIRRAIKRKRLQRATNPDSDWNLDFKQYETTEQRKNGSINLEITSENIVKKEPEEKNYVNLLPKSNRNRRKIISDDDDDETTDFLEQKAPDSNLRESERPFVSFFQAQPPISTAPVVEKHISSSPIAASNQAQEQYPQSSSPSSPHSSSDESLSQILRRSRALQSSNSTTKTSISPLEKPLTSISKKPSNSNISKNVSPQLSIDQPKLSIPVANLPQKPPCDSSRTSSHLEGLLTCNNKNITVSKDSLEFPQNSAASKGKKSRKRQRQRRKKDFSKDANHLKTKPEISKSNHRIRQKRKNKKKMGSVSTLAPNSVIQLSDSMNLSTPKNLSPTNIHGEIANIAPMEKQRKKCEISGISTGLENEINTDYNQFEPPYEERTSSFQSSRKIPNYLQHTKPCNFQPIIVNQVESYSKDNGEIFSEESRVKGLKSIPQGLHQNLHATDPSRHNSLDNDLRRHIGDDKVSKNPNFTEVSQNANRISPRVGSNQQNDRLQSYLNILTNLSENEKPDKSLENGRTEMTITSQLPNVDVNMYQEPLESTSGRNFLASSRSFTTNNQRDEGNPCPAFLPQKTHVPSTTEKMNLSERNSTIGSSLKDLSKTSEIARTQSLHNSHQLQETSIHSKLKSSSTSRFQSEFSRVEDSEECGNNSRHDLIKEVVVGVECLTLFPLNFGNFEISTEKTLKETMDSVDKIHFNQLCIAQDFQNQHCLIKSPVIWQEKFTTVDPNDRDTIKKIEMVFNELVIRCAGLLAVINKYVILMFPVRREEWRFIDQSPEISPEFRLRYAIFSNNFLKKQTSPPEGSRVILSQPQALSYEAKKLLIVRLLGQFIRRYENFSLCNYYLLFPPSTSQMANFVKSCLFSYNPNTKIYGSMTDGSWDTFNQNQTLINSNNAMERGISRVVLIHESAITELFRIPKLSTILNNTETAFWQFSDGSSSHSLYPSRYSQPNFKLGNITATELFPNGCVVFLTPSFLVAEPKSAYEFIRWFVAEIIQKQVIPCKFMGAYNLPSYVLDVAKSKASEAASYEKRHAKNPRKKEVLKERFLDYNTCNIRWGLYNELYKLSQCYHNNSESQETSECFLLQAPSLINPDNEHELIRWFAAWALLNSDIFRRFLVIGTGLSSTPRAKYLKEYPVKNRESLSSSKTSIPLNSAQMTTEAGGLNKGGPEGKSISNLDTQTSNASSEEKLLEAKFDYSNKSLETGINKVSQDLLNITNTISSNPVNTNVTFNSLVPELGKRILDTSSLDTIQMPRLKPSESEGKIHNCKGVDPYDGNWVGHKSAASKTEDSNICTQQQAIELKELKFESTTEWYQRLKTRGSGWEHITITELSEARKLLEFIT
ncbi:putative chromo domain-containing protein [Erysiphe neolycopersici]|uniref:Putative chromo domain-containing protein n=1 Tax=Erysiphe neolycopersici TaxID=212602 RepID=A0A420I1H5_9PEZI|nr:putative chromo domain-containing protein [Erysiphe neolycopersici]